MCPHVTHASFGALESTFQTAYRLVQPFLHSSVKRVPILYNGPPLRPSKLPLCVGGSERPCNALFLGPTRVHNPKVISIGSAVFLLAHDRDRQTDIQTDRPRYPVCNNRPHLRSTAMRPINTSNHVYGAVIMARPLREFTRFI